MPVNGDLSPAEQSLLTRPERVMLLGLGVSRETYADQVILQTIPPPDAPIQTFDWDEIWVLNAGISVYRHDKAFVMDDLRRQAKLFPRYGRTLAEHDRPIITSRPYPEFPMSVRYPIEEAIETVGDDFFTNTVCYALAYAMIIKVKEIWIYGCDFHYPDLAIREEGGQNTAYFLGMMRYFGMKYYIPDTSTLLSANKIRAVNGRPMRSLYGYEIQPRIKEGSTNGTESSGGAQIRAEEGNQPGGINADDSIRSP